MQEQDERFALPIDLVMKPYTAHSDEPAALVGEFVGRPALVGVHRDEKRPERQQDEQGSEGKR
jgi:predicted aconitase